MNVLDFHDFLGGEHLIDVEQELHLALGLPDPQNVVRPYLRSEGRRLSIHRSWRFSFARLELLQNLLVSVLAEGDDRLRIHPGGYAFPIASVPPVSCHNDRYPIKLLGTGDDRIERRGSRAGPVREPLGFAGVGGVLLGR